MALTEVSVRVKSNFRKSLKPQKPDFLAEKKIQAERKKIFILDAVFTETKNARDTLD